MVSTTLSPTEVTLSQTNKIYDEMTHKLTYHYAATIIADKNFPQIEKLPPITPLPFNTLGHQVMLDYRLLIHILDEVISEMKNAIKDMPTGHVGIFRYIMGIFIGIVTGFIGLAIVQGLFDSPIVSIGAGLLVGFVAYAMTVEVIINTKEVLANVRAQAIEDLLKNHPRFLHHTNKQIDRIINHVGNGKFDDNCVPVLVLMNNKHPFPGYGELKAETQYICRPKNADKITVMNLDEMRHHIAQQVMTTLNKYDFAHISCGEVVVVNGNSLRIDSPWLNSERAPRLYINQHEFNHAEQIDSHASIRKFFAVQILFPENMTTVTFFLRPFMAGNSASVQMAVSTIGPASMSEDYLLKRLLRYQTDKSEKPVPLAQPNQNKQELKSSQRVLAEAIQAIGKIGDEFQINFKVDYIRDFDLYKLPEDNDKIRELMQKTIEESVMWPGRFITPINWRENHALDFTDDFFGKLESVASVKTLYDQISRAILQSLSDLGFDISDYQDSQGNIMVNADKIDQLVLGEKIQIVDDKTKIEEKPTPPTATNTTIAKPAA